MSPVSACKYAHTCTSLCTWRVHAEEKLERRPTPYRTLRYAYACLLHDQIPCRFTLLAPISPTLFSPSSSLAASLLVSSSVRVRAIRREWKRHDVSLSARRRRNARKGKRTARSRGNRRSVALSLAICWRVTEIGAGARTIGVLLG